MASPAADVLVIGGGAIGAASALELTRRGARVTILERGPELAWACSAGNAGIITMSHAEPLSTPAAVRQGLRWMFKSDSPLALRPRPALVPWLARFVLASTRERAREGTRILRELTLASLKMHEELAGSGLEFAFEKRGLLNAYMTEEALEAGRHEAHENAEAGLANEILDADETRARVPALTENIRGGTYYPEEAHCEPRQFVHEVGRVAVAEGAELRTGIEVIGFTRRSGRVTGVETTAGRVEADTIVLAAGSWTSELAKRAGIFVPIEGGKGYHVEFERSAGDPELPLGLMEARVALTPLPGRLRIAGTLELAGLDDSIDHVRVNAIVRAAQQALPGLTGRPVTHVWRGLRPCTPDGLPIIGRPGALENLVVAAGHGMWGLQTAPVTGRLVGQAVLGEKPDFDLEPLRPDRFKPLLPMPGIAA